MVWRPPQPPPEALRGGVKGDAGGVGSHLLQLAGDSGGEHGAEDRQQELDLRVGSLARADRSLVRQEWNQEPSQSPVQHLAAVPWLLAGAS
jgi:hypothetical protein